MTGQIPKSLYWPDTQDSLILAMRSGTMPQPFIRRMRMINLISAIVLRKIDAALIAPFDVEDLSHILDKQISQDAIIDQLDNKELAEALTTGNLSPLWELSLK
jgi:hypothetical protein